jgi:hypothetical protein
MCFYLAESLVAVAWRIYTDTTVLNKRRLSAAQAPSSELENAGRTTKEVMNTGLFILMAEPSLWVWIFLCDRDLRHS